MTGLLVAVAVAAALTLAAGCGDDGTRCGDGTTEVDGACTPDIRKACGDGTVLANGVCVIAPTTCGVGTVLIADRCIDPTGALTIDLEESPEPNGLAVAASVEASTAPAGTIDLAAIGTPFIVHGHITPFRDGDGDGQLDPDVDTYVLNVATATLLDISVDGVGGTQGGFYLIGAPGGPVPGYQRYAVALTGDTAHRRLFLPVAGSYELAIADARSLAIGRTPPPAAGSGDAAGGPDAAYYASITSIAVPAATALVLDDAGVATQRDTLAVGQVAFYTTTVSGGDLDVRVTMAGSAAASLAAILGGALAGYADEIPATKVGPATDAELALSAVASGAAPMFVVDAVYNEGAAPAVFSLQLAQRAAPP